MSWMAYIQNLEAGKGKCKYACIYGRQPFGLWAESQDKSLFPITPEDIAAALKAIVGQDMGIMGTDWRQDQLHMPADGGGLFLYVRGKGDYKDYSLVIALSRQALVLGFNPDPDVKTACVRDGIESIRDYLISAGY